MNTNEKLQIKFVKEISKIPGNEVCADCGIRYPRWADISFGVLVCFECIAYHRKLTAAVSECKSLSLDNITPPKLLLLKEVGNTIANGYFEGLLNLGGQSKQINQNSKADERNSYIYRKYVEKQFVKSQNIIEPNEFPSNPAKMYKDNQEQFFQYKQQPEIREQPKEFQISQPQQPNNKKQDIIQKFTKQPEKKQQTQKQQQNDFNFSDVHHKEKEFIFEDQQVQQPILDAQIPQQKPVQDQLIQDLFEEVQKPVQQAQQPVQQIQQPFLQAQKPYLNQTQQQQNQPQNNGLDILSLYKQQPQQYIDPFSQYQNFQIPLPPVQQKPYQTKQIPKNDPFSFIQI